MPPAAWHPQPTTRRVPRRRAPRARPRPAGWPTLQSTRREGPANALRATGATGSRATLLPARISANSEFFSLDPPRRRRLGSAGQIQWTHGFVGSGIFAVPFRGPVEPCRPTGSLAFVGPMVIAGILIGLVLGAGGAWLALRAHYAARLGLLEDARGSLEGTMRSLAADALATSSESFLALAKSQLEQLQA